MSVTLGMGSPASVYVGENVELLSIELVDVDDGDGDVVEEVAEEEDEAGEEDEEEVEVVDDEAVVGFGASCCGRSGPTYSILSMSIADRRSALVHHWWGSILHLQYRTWGLGEPLGS